MKYKTVCIDPGHGMSNKRAGVFDPGACSGPLEEARIAMDWANELRAILQARGHKVIRTRINNSEACPIGDRAWVASKYGSDVMISIHCNAATGSATGTEVIYRADMNRAMAAELSKAVSGALGLRDRGAKTEVHSQHKRLAVMAFQPCFLIELGFIDNTKDAAALTDPQKRLDACAAIAELL